VALVLVTGAARDDSVVGGRRLDDCGASRRPWDLYGITKSASRACYARGGPPRRSTPPNETGFEKVERVRTWD